MTKQQKLITKFCRKPPPRDFTWGELETLLGCFGYTPVPGKGSHQAFFSKERDDYIRGIPKPHPGNEVKQYVLRNIRQQLEEREIL